MNHDPQHQNQFAANERTNNSNDLSWMAFRYIAGEMRADECRDFEIRLQDDQLARQTVADAVESSRLIDQACSQHASPTETSNQSVTTQLAQSRAAKTSPTKPLILAVLACSLAAIVISNGINQGGRHDSVAITLATETTSTDEAQIDLAEAWADSDWEDTLIAQNSIGEMEAEFDLNEANTEFDSDWIEAIISDMDRKSISIDN